MPYCPPPLLGLFRNNEALGGEGGVVVWGWGRGVGNSWFVSYGLKCVGLYKCCYVFLAVYSVL